MKKNKRRLIASTLLAALLLTACTGGSGTDVMSDIRPEGVASPSLEQTIALSGPVSDFTWKLFQQSLSQPGEEATNLMISPFSAYVALTMALNGADGETAEEMRSALSSAGIDPEALNMGVLGWMQALSDPDAKVQWSIANSIWTHTEYVPSTSFLQTNANYFAADVRTLDFKDASAPDTINQWVKDKTNDRIEEIVEKIDPDVMMYLINAVWFKGDWETPFKADSTYPAPFYAVAGEREVPFMNRTGQMSFLDGQIGQGVLLPYEDPRFAFLAILPAEGTTPTELAASMSGEDLLSYLKTSAETHVALQLPKFESGYETDLRGALRSLGMQSAFDPFLADFSLMSEDGNRDLYITAVKQKTWIRVDEKGTEAAAATSVEMGVTSMPLIEQELTFDRPFLYGIVDLESGVPLFLGVMENPAEQ